MGEERMESIIGYLAKNLVIYIAGFFVGKFGKIDVVFGVTVPRHLKDDGQIDELSSNYKRIYGIIAGLILAAITVANNYFRELRWLFDGYVFVWFILTIYLYIMFYKKVKQVVKEAIDVEE